MTALDLTADQALVRRGADACRTQKALAARCGCSERLISEVAQGKRGLPVAPVPTVGQTPAQLIHAAIAAGGSVPEVHRGPGRAPRLDATHVAIALTASEAARLRRTRVDLSSAVLAYLAAHPRPPRPWTAQDFPAPSLAPRPTVEVVRRLSPDAVAAVAAYLVDVRLRPSFLRAVVANMLRAAESA